ncbi:Phosphoribulokinase/uridine kinase [Penicillium malachiteum]|uniref:Phosphoribulokinase/uridine kinase n=1 Tax=Penicillium malachiteum TaxID=1324776 RepID=A0AAD6HAR8_9EURO|nr:Phosphoribulokinase/uridine kinase [Penicillium malachiteum]
MSSEKQSDQANAIVVGISGPSSSGKTTLARLLQRIFCGVDLQSSDSKLNTFIIHEDDFYYPDDQIPYVTTKSGERIQDWDTAAAIDTNFLAQSLSYVREHGRLPPRLQSKEDQNEQSDSGVEDALVLEMRDLVSRQLASRNSRTKTIAFMEGFLLYSDRDEKSPLRPVHDAIHLPLFLPAPYTNVKTRREARSGYVTIGAQPTQEDIAAAKEAKGEQNEQEGEESKKIDLETEDDRPSQNFWVDPPGYVDDIVWPRYVEDHAWLLIPDESVDGDLVAQVGEGINVRTDAGVIVAPGKGLVGMDVILKWAVEEILAFHRSF